MKNIKRILTNKNNAVSDVVGIVITILIVVSVSATIFVYLSLTTEDTSRPDATIDFAENKITDELTVLRAIPDDITYAKDNSTPNLIFETDATDYYVINSAGTLSIKIYDEDQIKIDKDATTQEIRAGDIITGFQDGKSYSIAWVITNKALGAKSF